MAYNTKLYKSTGSGWDEVRVASEWGLIANKPSTFTPTAHAHAAADVTQGTFNVARIPNLSASKITSGVFSVDRIPDLDASKITSGTFATSRIPDLHASKITTGIFNIDRIPTLPTSKIQELDLILFDKAPKTMPIYSTTSSIYTSNANYHNAIVVIDSSSTRYVYIDSDSEGTYAPPGTQITVIRKGSGNVVISASGGTYLSEGSKRYINERYQAVTLIKDSVADTWFVVGALR